jgi:hypothetical protein
VDRDFSRPAPTGFYWSEPQRKFAGEVMRRLAVGLIVVGLAVGIWALWPGDDPDPTPTTTLSAAETTTTVPPTISTTTTIAATTSTAPTHVVATVEDAEAILRNLWFGWFEGIYNQDEARIREVVGTQAAVENARSQFGVMTFERAPEPDDLSTSESELLHSSQDCLAVWTTLTLSGFRSGESTGVHVLRWVGDKWVSVSVWQYKDDLWDQDCQGELEPVS